MKISLLSSILSPNNGGLSVSVPNMAWGLQKYKDLNISVFGFIDPNYPDEYKKWGPNVNAVDHRRFFKFKYSKYIYNYLLNFQPDLIDVQGVFSWATFANKKFYKIYKTPYIITPRGMLQTQALSHKKIKKYLFRILIENEHLHNARIIRTTSEIEAENVRKLGFKNPIAIIPNSVKISNLATEKKKSSFTLLFLGRLHPLKGLKILIDVWSKLETKYSNWELKIAGIDQNNYEKYLRDYVKFKDLKNVSFLGSVFGDDKELLYRNSDLFILPSYTENFGLVVAESLVQETPVITTLNTPWNILKQSNSGWHIPLNEKTMLKTIETAMNTSPVDLRKMGKNGRELIKNNFSINSMNDKIRQMYFWAINDSQKPNFIH